MRKYQLVLAIFFFSLVWLINPLLSSAEESAEKEEIRFGIVSFYNPRLMVMRYQPLLDALEKRTPYRYKLILTRTYDETVEKLKHGDIDIAYLGPVTFIRAIHSFDAEPLVRLNTNNSDVYYSVIAVREESEIETLEDLEGKHFAFGSQLSTSSHLYPRMMLQEKGLLPDKISSFRYYKHHDSAARAVLTGEADACGIRDVVAERYENRGLRVIARSQPIPNFPLVVKSSMDQAKKKILKDALLSLDPNMLPDSEEMKDWDEELKSGFKDVKTSDYDEIRRYMEKIFGKNAYSGDPSMIQVDK